MLPLALRRVATHEAYAATPYAAHMPFLRCFCFSASRRRHFCQAPRYAVRYIDDAASAAMPLYAASVDVIERRDYAADIF